MVAYLYVCQRPDLGFEEGLTYVWSNPYTPLSVSISLEQYREYYYNVIIVQKIETDGLSIHLVSPPLSPRLSTSCKVPAIVRCQWLPDVSNL